MVNRVERAHPRPTHPKNPQRGQRQRVHKSTARPSAIWPHDLPLLLSHWPNNCYTLCYATSRPLRIGIQTWPSGKNSSFPQQESTWSCVFFFSSNSNDCSFHIVPRRLLSKDSPSWFSKQPGCFVCLMKSDVTCFPILKEHSFYLVLRLPLIAFSLNVDM